MSYNDLRGKGVTWRIPDMETGKRYRESYELQNCNLYSIMYLSLSHWHINSRRCFTLTMYDFKLKKTHNHTDSCEQEFLGKVHIFPPVI